MKDIKVFISYGEEDRFTAETIYDGLKQSGLKPWMDTIDLNGGENRENKITTAINESNYIIVLLSSKSLSKKSSFHKELKIALQAFKDCPEGQIFIIPVRLDKCQSSYPDLQKLWAIDLFPSPQKGFDKILRSISSDIVPNGIENINLPTDSQEYGATQLTYLQPPITGRSSFLPLITLFALALISLLTTIIIGKLFQTSPIKTDPYKVMMAMGTLFCLIMFIITNSYIYITKQYANIQTLLIPFVLLCIIFPGFSVAHILDKSYKEVFTKIIICAINSEKCRLDEYCDEEEDMNKLYEEISMHTKSLKPPKVEVSHEGDSNPTSEKCLTDEHVQALKLPEVTICLPDTSYLSDEKSDMDICRKKNIPSEKCQTDEEPDMNKYYKKISANIKSLKPPKLEIPLYICRLTRDPIVTPPPAQTSIGDFVYIPPGNFIMGSPENEPGRDHDEKQHKVIITKGFYMKTTEVTQGQWKTVMENNPSYFAECGDNCPVEQVSWNDVNEFIKKLNKKERTNAYRLPTEAEWEYAARAGTTTEYHWGNIVDFSKANYGAAISKRNGEVTNQDKGKTMPVGSFKPNLWGLYDMHGNVWEWVQDRYGEYPSGILTDPKGQNDGAFRVLRGGGWYYSAQLCRSAQRFRYSPNFKYDRLGFRLVFVP